MRKFPYVGFSGLLLLVSCVSTVSIKSKGYVKKEAMSKDFKGSSLSPEDLLANLSRNYFQGEGVYDQLYVEAILQTPIGEYARLKKRGEKEGWSEKKIDKKMNKVKKRLKKKTCFHLLAKSNDEKALEASNWSIAAKIDKKKYSFRSLSKLKDNSQHSALGSSERIFDHLQDDAQYYLESSICFSRKKAPKEQIYLRVKPDFHETIKTIKLAWYLD